MSEKVRNMTADGTVLDGDLFYKVGSGGGDQKITGAQMREQLSTSSLSQNPVENEYTTTAQMITDQGAQTTGFFQFVSTGDQYYEKLSTNSSSINDYRLLTASETSSLLTSNEYKNFTIEVVTPDSSPVNEVSRQQIALEYDSASNLIDGIVFNATYSTIISNILAEEDDYTYKIQLYNRKTSKLYIFDVLDLQTVNSSYTKVLVAETYLRTEFSIDHPVEVNWDLDASGLSSVSWGSITGTLSDQTDLQTALDGKQATLVSGTNIKTVNGNSLLGSGDLTVSSGFTQVAYSTALTFATNQISSFGSVTDNSHTQSGAITFTYDFTNAVEGNSRIIEILSDGNTWTLPTSQNNTRSINLNSTTVISKNKNIITPESGKRYQLNFDYSNGQVYCYVIDVNTFVNDIIPPTFTTSPNATSISATGFTLNAQTDENTTIYTVVVADGATAPNASEIIAGTGSGGSGELASGNASDNGSGVNIALTGLTLSTAYDCYTIAVDGESNQSSIVQIDVTTVAANILFEDDFTGTTIDTAKWDVTNPNSANLTISQNDKLLFTRTTDTTVSGSTTNNITSDNTYAKGGALAVLMNRDLGFETSVFSMRWIFDTTIDFIGIQGTGTLDEVRIIIKAANVIEYDVTVGSISANNRFKIDYDSSDNISFYYWGGASWTQIGTTQNYNLGTVGSVMLSTSSSSGDDAGDVFSFDDLYLTDNDYSTETP